MFRVLHLFQTGKFVIRVIKLILDRTSRIVEEKLNNSTVFTFKRKADEEYSDKQLFVSNLDQLVD